jgi:hypothetical protein
MNVTQKGELESTVPQEEVKKELPTEKKTWRLAAVVFGYVASGVLAVYFVCRFLICAPFMDEEQRDFSREMGAVRADLDQKQREWQTT